MNTSKTKEELIEFIACNGAVKFLFFWGHQKPADGSVTQSCLSQWYDAGFELDGVYYRTAEHYMMAEKARLFDDSIMREKILQSEHPHEAKKLGRSVRGYDERLWHGQRFSIVVRGSTEKFSQNRALKEYLLNTQGRVLVEASPQDRIWGIGLEKASPDASNPAKWRGQNLLGFALMQARLLLVSAN